jgi:hypothetical protein
MGVVKLSTAGILDYSKTSNFLSGNSAASYSTGFDLLETTNISTDTASVTLSGLSAYSDYKHLQVRIVARNTNTNSNSTAVYIRLNGDSGNNYSKHQLGAGGGSVYSSAGIPADSAEMGTVAGNKATTNPTSVFGAVVAEILDFSSPNKFTTLRGLGGVMNETNEARIALSSSVWRNTDSVTSLLVYLSSADFFAGSRVSLYGSK